MTNASTPVSVPTAPGTMPAHLWLPPAGRGPGIVLFQEIFGISAYIEKRAADLAQAGMSCWRRSSIGAWANPAWPTGRTCSSRVST